MNLDEAIADIERQIEEAMPLALMDGAEIIADRAKRQHRYQNRTGLIEANTRPESVSGSWRAGYTIRVVGARPYGSFLEEGTSRIHGYEFLLPAYDATKNDVAQTIVTFVQNSIR